MHNISWFHRLFASVGIAVKILLRWATWCRRAFVIVMPKRGKKGAVAEDGEEPKTEPEVKKSKVGVGAKKNEKEAAGEGPALYEDPPDQKTSPSGKSATLKICS